MGNRPTKTSGKHSTINLGDYRYSEEIGHRLIGSDHANQRKSSREPPQQNDTAAAASTTSTSDSTIWRGYRVSDKQAVSIKKILIASSDLLATKEIDTMLSVEHSNILKLLDVHVQTPYVYVISEFFTCDLEEFLSAVKGQIDWRDQLPVLARNLAHGYYGLYEKRILHRNINPRTIVVTHRGTEISFKLSGFEYSKHADVSETLITCNADAYKSPELGAAIVAERRLNYDHRLDIWSLGVVLYRCAVGRCPYAPPMMARLFFTLATFCPTPSSTIEDVNLRDFELRLPDDVPRKLVKLLRGMLEISFVRRMTADQFVRDDYVTGGDSSMTPATKMDKSKSSTKSGERTTNGRSGNDSSRYTVGDGEDDSPRDSFSLRTKQVENIGRHTLKRRKQMADERRLRDLEFVSGSTPDRPDRNYEFDLNDHYSTLRHLDDVTTNGENDQDATLRNPIVSSSLPISPPPLPPRKKLSSTSFGQPSNNHHPEENNNNNNSSSDTGSVGSQTLLAEGMNILSEPATIRSMESDASMGTIREARGTCDEKEENGDVEFDDQRVIETDLDNGDSIRRIIVGRYEYREDPESFLGRGSFGSVWSGRCADTGEPVAIKALTFLAGADREIRILRSVDHPNVLRFIYAHKIANTLYMVTELCRCDLKAFLDASPNGRLPNADVRKVARDLAGGYRALHSARILHRDIKPKNILLAPRKDSSHEFTLKLADFGCGRFRDSSQYGSGSSPMTNGAMGTIDYMAPEVGARQMNPDTKYDARADIWSIGVVLHECACGQLPVKRMDLYRLSMSVASNGRQADGGLDTSTFLGASSSSSSSSSEEHPDEFKQLLYTMLQPLYQLRMTPDEFFRHPYVLISPGGLGGGEGSVKDGGGLRLATSRPRSRASLALSQC